MRETVRYRVEQAAVSITNENVTMHEAEAVFREALISAALASTKGNRTRAAQRLGIHRNTLLSELRRTR